jgi:hypothetical protein
MINNIVVRACELWKQHINLHIPNTSIIPVYLQLFCFNIIEAIRTNYRLKIRKHISSYFADFIDI